MTQVTNKSAIYVVGIHIEGIGRTVNGDTTVGEQNGVMWCTSHGEDLTVESYDWLEALIFDFSSMTTSVERKSASVRFGAQSFRLHGNMRIFPSPAAPEAVKDTGEAIMYRQRRAVSYLTADQKTLAAGDIPIADSSLGGKIVYIGGETIKLGTWDAVDEEYTGCQRGYYGSRPEAHLQDANVYTAPPFWKNRRVRMYTYEIFEDGSTPEFRQRWVGRISEDGIRQVGPFMQIDCVEIGADLNGAQVNLDPTPVPTTSLDWISVPKGGGVTETHLSGAIELDNNTSKGSSTSVFVQIGDSVFEQKDGRTDLIRPSWVPSPDVEFDEGQSVKAVEENGWEVLVAPEQLSPLTYPKHPMSLVAALLWSNPNTGVRASKFDVLHGNFALDLLWMFDDSAPSRLSTLIEETKWIEMDRIVLATDGKPVQAFELIRQFMQTAGFIFAPTDEGKLDFARDAAITMDEYSDALSNKIAPRVATPESQSGEGDVVDLLGVTIDGYPWQEPKPFRVHARPDDTGRHGRVNSRPDINLRFRYLARENISSAINIASRRILLLAHATPKVVVKVHDYLRSGLDYSIGTVVTSDDLALVGKDGKTEAWLVDNDGNKITQIDSSVQFAGRIFSRTWHPGNNTYVLTLDFVNFPLGNFIRWRAPSMHIISTSVDGSGNMTLTGPATSDFGNTGTDAETLSQGDDVQVMEPTMVAWSATVLEVTSVSGADVTVNGDFGSVPTDQGYYLEPADVDSYDNDGLNGQFPASVGRVYAALADAAGTVGTAEEEADYYG